MELGAWHQLKETFKISKGNIHVENNETSPVERLEARLRRLGKHPLFTKQDVESVT